MQHPKVEALFEALNGCWEECLKKAIRDVEAKIAERGPEYEQETPLWMRLHTSEQYSTLIRLKAERVSSELRRLRLPWNPDNAQDLIAYTLFLIAHHDFVTCELKDCTPEPEESQSVRMQVIDPEVADLPDGIQHHVEFLFSGNRSAIIDIRADSLSIHHDKGEVHLNPNIAHLIIEFPK